MKLIFLIVIGLSLSLYADFSRNDDTQIVTDNVSHLQWQDNIEAKNVSKTWKQAIDYCEALNLGGYTDWRLPNINELKSIVTNSKSYPSVVNGFVNIKSDGYWSSTTNIDAKSYAWVEFFYQGSSNSTYKSAPIQNVVCVRGGQ